MTITRPCRRITLHLSQILLTLGWTFIELLSELTSGSMRMPDDVGGFASLLLVPVDDAAAGQVVSGKFDDHSVRLKDANVVLPHLATDGG